MSDREDRHVDSDTPVAHPSLRRRPKHRKSVYTRPVNRGRLVFALLFIGALAIGGALYSYFQTGHYAIELDGKPLVALATREQAEEAILLLKERYAPSAPEMVTFKEGQLTIHTVHKPVHAMGTKDAANLLDDRLTIELEGWAIFVRNTPMVLLPTREKAAETISLMLSRGQGKRVGIPTFKERIRTDIYHQTEGDEHRIPILTPQKAAEELVRPPQPQTYTVAKGDSFWSIANAHGLTVQQLQELNPTVDHTKLDVGDIIKLPDIPSPVTVVVRDSGLVQ